MTNFKVKRKTRPFRVKRIAIIFIMRTFPALYEKYRVSRKKALRKFIQEQRFKIFCEIMKKESNWDFL